MIEKDIMSEEAFNEIVESFELVEKLTPYGRKNLKYHIKRLQQENQELKNQQKEFIEYLEDRIKFWKDKIFENAITESDWTLTLWRNKLGILEESLSKYKEIIGVKDEENMQNY